MMDSAKNSLHQQALPEICADVFSLIVYLREGRAFEPQRALYDKVIALFNAMDKKARQAQKAESEIEDARYALVALIDETVGWESRLEYELFGTRIAGEKFFDKLDREREKGDDARDEVLGVYYICLMLGFEGKNFRATEKLQAYIRDFQKQLRAEGIEKLSPRGERPQETGSRKRRGIPSWAPWAFAGVCVVASMLVFFLLNHQINNWAEGTILQIQRFVG